VTDAEAFTFSLTRSTKHPIKQDQKAVAIQNFCQYLPLFGKGHEFYAASDCNQNETSQSSIGHTYVAPEGIAIDTDKATNYMAGKKNFKV